MKISVDYKDINGKRSKLNFELSQLAFIKHFGFAGQGFAQSSYKLLRSFSMFLHYTFYLNSLEFKNNRFSEPPIYLYDPTEKGQFSNLAGRAFADFLSKRIDKSLFSVNYEAAMKLKELPIQEQRPDLLAFNQKSMFAIEAKGLSRASTNMNNHLIQSCSGKIPVTFSVACVSYNLYKEVQFKYYKANYKNNARDEEVFNFHSKKYYSRLLSFLENNFFEISEISYGSEKFYEVGLPYHYFESVASNKHFTSFVSFEMIKKLNPKLILPIRIREFAETGLPIDLEPFFMDSKDQAEDLYIDTDRVGLKIK